MRMTRILMGAAVGAGLLLAGGGAAWARWVWTPPSWFPDASSLATTGIDVTLAAGTPPSTVRQALAALRRTGYHTAGPWRAQFVWVGGDTFWEITWHGRFARSCQHVRSGRTSCPPGTKATLFVEARTLQVWWEIG